MNPTRLRVAVAALVAFRIVVAVPFALRGPGLLLDDWWVLRNVHFHGVWAGAGHGQALARPGAWLLFNLLFGIIGPHPLALYVVLTAANVVVTILLFAVLRRVLHEGVALAATVTWVLLPNHATLDHWASTINIVVALGFALGGIVLLDRGYERRSSLLPASACFVVAALCYEAVLPLSVAALAAVPTLRRLPFRRWPTAITVAVLGVVGLWMLTHTQKKLPEAAEVADFSLLLPAHFGRGLAVDDRTGTAVMVVGLAGLCITAARLAFSGWRPSTGAAERLVIAGVGVIVIGALPFAKFPLSVVGINDRANVVMALGAALAWTGLLWQLVRWRPAAAAAAVAFLCVVVPARWQKDVDYERAGDSAARIVATLDRLYPGSRGPFVVGPEPIVIHGVVGLVSDWDTEAAMQLRRDDPLVRATVTASLDAFCAARAEETLDLRTWTPKREACP